ncbi:SRPBCC family protein [Massilia glaciei]|uniref:Cyclase/dehydrase n=1 Tax=Massilia glaciei TaxID=1524097 RepID=A0A2U2I608_9BURK|nr:SRPBCC family protein [Massilia glaciei]PWF55172.1 cyclase/dehydrase [Massilia glaciei]
MENTSEQQTRRQVRQGYWQYPDMAVDAEREGEARPAGQAQAGPQAQAQARAAPRQTGNRSSFVGTTLGLFSIGVGMANLLAPRAVARAMGLPDWPMLVRLMGARELACGIGLLAQPRSVAWRWTRVAGDVMDLSILGASAFAPGARPRRLAATAIAVAGFSALDVRASTPQLRKLSHEAPAGASGPQRVQQAVPVNRSPDECYRFWRNFEAFPTFMRHLESVVVQDERRSHWCARGPAGSSYEWDAEITQDVSGEVLGWQSLPGGDVDNAGTVRFTAAPGGRGTIVQVNLDYMPPAGPAGTLVARLFGEEPSQRVKDDLRRFKQLIETGEIASTEGQPHGKRTLKARLFNLGADK